MDKPGVYSYKWFGIASLFRITSCAVLQMLNKSWKGALLWDVLVECCLIFWYIIDNTYIQKIVISEITNIKYKYLNSRYT